MATSPATWLTLDRQAGDLEGQIYRALRESILRGQMSAAQRLPSSRALSISLDVSRSTVVKAYDRLKAEGYLLAQTGSATRPAAVAPSALARKKTEQVHNSPAASPSQRKIFEPGVPDLRDFPHAAWARHLGARARALRVHDLGYSDSAGLPELQAAIIDHISATRGVSAEPGQVLIVPSTGAAIDLLSRVLLQPAQPEHNIVWMEEPGYGTAQALFRAAGARLVPVACDNAGIDVAKASGPPPRLIYTTPSHQYPTGVTMSLQRRLALLEAARQYNAVVIEDDYDSEFHYGARPIAALQGIDRSDVVAYLGTFSKTLAPGLRIAYLIVPPWLVPEISEAMRLRGAVVSIHLQAALADFIREGRLRAYLRRQNALYATRMAATIDALRHHCGDKIGIGDGREGLQLATWFHDASVNDEVIAQTLSAHGFAMKPMSRFYLGPARPGLLLGIARVDVDEVDEIARQLRGLLDTP